MNIDNLNNLIELFAYQANKQNKSEIFLEWLNPTNKKIYTWEQTEKNILKLSKVIKENIDAIKNILINSFFLAITIGMIIASGGIGKNELSIKDTNPK